MQALIQGFTNYGKGGDTAAEAIACQFQIDASTFDDVVRLAGNYGHEDYTGDAVVFFEDATGSLFEVSGSHCSCNGLEGLWAPSKVSLEYVRQRAHALADNKDRSYSYGHEFLLKSVATLWGAGAA